MPISFKFSSNIGPGFFGIYLSKKSGKGLSPIKQIPVLSFLLLVINFSFLAISLTSFFVIIPRGNNDLEIDSLLIECKK